MERHAAQPSTLATVNADEVLRSHIGTLWYVIWLLQTRKATPRNRKRVWVELAGVLGDVEAIRQAIKE